MRNQLLIWVSCLLLLGCGKTDKAKETFSLQGAWELSQIDYPIGRTETFPQNGRTLLRLYEGDSVLFESLFTQTETSLVIAPRAKAVTTLIDKGGGEWLYLEDANPRPLTVVDDTTMIVQQNGVRYTWHRADSIGREWHEEIRSIAEKDLQEGGAGARHYVLSAKEREQKSYINWLVGIVAGTLFFSIVVGCMYVSNRRLMKRLQQSFRQLQENYEQRPRPVKNVMETMESQFFASAEYDAFRRRIATGQRLRDDEWEGIEALVQRIYPSFLSQLRTLHPMSALEHQVCLLVKLRIPPSEIAPVLLRDVSTISSVRSRLYQKVFGQKGSTREWDKFFHSIGV